MLKTIVNNKLTWNYIQKPNRKDWKFIEETLGLPSNIMMEMTEAIQQPRVEKWHKVNTKRKKDSPDCDNLYININVPLFNRTKQSTEAGDLHIIITPIGITTVTFKSNMPVKSIFHHATKSERFKNEFMQDSTGSLLVAFLTELIALSFDKIKHINENIDWVKETIFEGDDYNQVQEISKIKLDILMFQRILKPQKNILNSLLHKEFNQINTPAIKTSIRQLAGTNVKVWNSIESAQEIIESLETTNNSMVSFNLSNTMRFLAAVSLITFAMSVVLGIFSIIPFNSFAMAHNPITFWVAMFMLFIIIIISFWFFRKKKWF